MDDLSGDWGDFEAGLGPLNGERPRSSTPHSESSLVIRHGEEDSPKLGSRVDILSARSMDGLSSGAGLRSSTRNRQLSGADSRASEEDDVGEGSVSGSIVINTLSDRFNDFPDQPGHTLPWRKSRIMRDIFSSSPEPPAERTGSFGAELNKGSLDLDRRDQRERWTPGSTLSSGGTQKESRGILNTPLHKFKTVEVSVGLPEATKSPRHYKPPLYVPHTRLSTGSTDAPTTVTRQRVVYPGGHRKFVKSSGASDASRSIASTAPSSPKKPTSPRKVPPQLSKPAQPLPPPLPAKEAGQFDTLTRARLDALVNELDMIHGGQEEIAATRSQPSASDLKLTPRRNFSSHSTSSSTYPSDIDFVDEDALRPRQQTSSEASAAETPQLPAPSERSRYSFDRAAPAPSSATPARGANSFSATSMSSARSASTKKGFISAKDYQAQQEPWPADDPAEEIDEFGIELPNNSGLKSSYFAGDRSKDWLNSTSHQEVGNSRTWEDSHVDRWTLGNDEYSPVLPTKGALDRSLPTETRNQGANGGNNTQDNLNVILETLNNRLEAKLDKIAALVASPMKQHAPTSDATHGTDEIASRSASVKGNNRASAPTPRRIVPAKDEDEEDQDIPLNKPYREVTSGKRYELGRALVTELLCKAHGTTPEQLQELAGADLSGRQLESLYGLSDACPNLKKLIANDNSVTFLTGVPWSVMHLSLVRNRLSSLTSFKQLRDLRILDVSHNQLQDISGLGSLLHLVELRADHNQISSLSGLHSLESLVRCSLRNNQLTEITTIEASKFSCLEFLDVSNNRLASLSGVEGFASLQTLIAESNQITEFEPARTLKSLVSVSLVQNQLATLDGSRLPSVRALKLDGNRITSIRNADRLLSLEVLSLNDQNGADIMDIEFAKMGALRHLQVADNVVTNLDWLGECSSLEVLDAGSCSLRGELPKEIAKNIPNLRLLNLSHNKLTSIANVKYLHRLRRLILFGNNLADFGAIMRAVKSCPKLEVLDLRENPVTEMYYAQLPSQLASSFGIDHQVAPDHAREEEKWLRLDDHYRQSLQDNDFVRRLCYRATLIDLLSVTIRILDGIPVTEREKRDARNRVAKLRQRVDAKKPLRAQSVDSLSSQTPRASAAPAPAIPSTARRTGAGGTLSAAAMATPAGPAIMAKNWTPSIVTPGLLPSRQLAPPKPLPDPTPAKPRQAGDPDPRTAEFWITSRQPSVSHDLFAHKVEMDNIGKSDKHELYGLPELPTRDDHDQRDRRGSVSEFGVAGESFEDMSVGDWRPVSYPLDEVELQQ